MVPVAAHVQSRLSSVGPRHSSLAPCLDEAELARLMERYGARLHTVVLSILSHPDDAQDVLQEFWVKVATRISQLRDPARLTPWLFAVARNTALDFMRSRQTDVQTTVYPENADALDPASESSQPEMRLMHHEQRREVWGILGTLCERDRLVLLLRDFEGRSYGEIAEALQVSPSTAHVVLCRARQRFRDRFSRSQLSA